MSDYAITLYYNDLENAIHYGGSTKETAIRFAFQTIAEKFNTYKFADYKDKVIDLLKRVCTVSVETMKVVGEMEEIKMDKSI